MFQQQYNVATKKELRDEDSPRPFDISREEDQDTKIKMESVSIESLGADS